MEELERLIEMVNGSRKLAENWLATGNANPRDAIVTSNFVHLETIIVGCTKVLLEALTRLAPKEEEK